MPDHDGVAEAIRGNVAASLAVHAAMLRDAELLAGVARAAAMITAAMRGGHRLLLIGNGGSAADAQHLAAEFVGRYRRERRALPALALTVNTSALTAIGNDYGFAEVFARQVEALAQAGDVLMGISTSGTSRNVADALLLGSAMGVATIAMTGASGGVLKDSADLCLRIPSTDTPRIQEGHILVGHTIAEVVEGTLCGEAEEEVRKSVSAGPPARVHARVSQVAAQNSAGNATARKEHAHVAPATTLRTARP
jgi:D-sedoheptulose 7-phosphate isomerase